MFAFPPQKINCPTCGIVIRNRTLNHHYVFGSQSLSDSTDCKCLPSVLADPTWQLCQETVSYMEHQETLEHPRPRHSKVMLIWGFLFLFIFQTHPERGWVSGGPNMPTKEIPGRYPRVIFSAGMWSLLGSVISLQKAQSLPKLFAFSPSLNDLQIYSNTIWKDALFVEVTVCSVLYWGVRYIKQKHGQKHIGWESHKSLFESANLKARSSRNKLFFLNATSD